MSAPLLPLLTDRTWFLPGLARGELTRPGAIGALTWLPTAMLAIRNLRIRSTWSPQDVAASAKATNFGLADPSRIRPGQVLVIP